MWLRSMWMAICGVGLAGLVWWTASPKPDPIADGERWRQVHPGLFRSPGLPVTYALVEDGRALLIDAAAGADLARLQKSGVEKVEQVLLTHHHRDTSARAAEWIAAGIPIKAPKAAAEWLTPENVAKFWKEALPLRSSRTAYLVHPTGVQGVDCSLEDGKIIEWRGWKIEIVASPGHTPDHLAFVARREKQTILFAGDALAAPGKLWTPFTTDWDHWTDAGLKPAAESLRKLAQSKPTLICPAHGPPIDKDCADALLQTADAVKEVAFLKSYERFTKERLGKPPEYAFLAQEQKESAGEKPWSKISDHLYLTGNTYALISKDKTILVVDPWGKRSVEQIARLQKDAKLGKVEVVMVSHAHYDHYDGIYDMPAREQFEVWTLDLVAEPIAHPLRYRAPYLDARPVKFDRLFKDGDAARWREYSFKFHHLPGQTYFTMGVETVIDGKKCFFTADNFFHHDQYSGSGGWMGLNRSWPLPYGASARKVLEASPDWVLAEHGGAFEFNAQDFRRRIEWAEAAAKAADAICPTGNHRHDWDPNRIAVVPQVAAARPGESVALKVQLDHHLPTEEKLTLHVAGRKCFMDLTKEVRVKQGGTVWEVRLELAENTPAGRQIFPITAVNERGEEIGIDACIVLDVAPARRN